MLQHLCTVVPFLSNFRVSCKAGIIKNVTGSKHCIGFWEVLVLEIYFYCKEILVSHLFCSMLLRPIGSPEKVSTKAQPRYVTCKCCFIFIFIFYSQFSCTFDFTLTYKKNRFLSSPNCMLNLLSTNQLQTFSSYSTFLCWYMRQELSAYKIDLILQPEACRYHR